jgi:hypothetical protein
MGKARRVELVEVDQPARVPSVSAIVIENARNYAQAEKLSEEGRRQLHDAIEQMAAYARDYNIPIFSQYTNGSLPDALKGLANMVPSLDSHLAGERSAGILLAGDWDSLPQKASALDERVVDVPCRFFLDAGASIGSHDNRIYAVQRLGEGTLEYTAMERDAFY